MKFNLKHLKLIICCVVCLVIVLNFRLIKASGSSMMPTISPGQYVLCCKRYRKPKVDDIVLIRKGNLFVLKRIVAGPGSAVDTYNHYWGQDNVPSGFYFVAGDNSDNSFDSRSEDFGLISEHEIWGHIILY